MLTASYKVTLYSI